MPAQPITAEERAMAKAMLRELRTTKIEVVLAPSERPEIAARGGMIRVVNQENPAWYRELCARFGSQRSDIHRWHKHKTRICRRLVLEALDDIASSRQGGVYVDRLIPHIRDEIERERQQFEAERAAYEARTNPPRARSYVKDRRA